MGWCSCHGQLKIWRWGVWSMYHYFLIGVSFLFLFFLLGRGSWKHGYWIIAFLCPFWGFWFGLFNMLIGVVLIVGFGGK